MNKHNQLMAACGLDCKECDIFRAPDNPEVAHQVVDWLKEAGSYRGKASRHPLCGL